jgi:hypothetical protein
LISKAERLNGSQLMDVYVELRNVSSSVEVYYDFYRSVLSCKVVDAKGNPAQQELSVASILHPDAVWLVLPSIARCGSERPSRDMEYQKTLVL